MASRSRASSAVMWFQHGRPVGDVSGKDVADAAVTSRRGGRREGVFVGVDWGNSHHQLCVLDSAGQLLEQCTLRHDVAGIAELTDRLRRHGGITGIAVERADGLLVEALQQQGHRLFCVSPKMAARTRERYRVAPTKSDAFDAFVLADSVRHEHRHWRPLAAPSPLLAELRALTRDRERLVWNQRDVENQLRAIVLAYHPAVLELFSERVKFAV